MGMFSGIEIDWHKFVSFLGTFAIIGTFIGWFPYIAAFAAFVWYVIQIWESRTIQHWWTNRRMIQKARKIAKLKAKEKVIAAKLLALQTVRAAQKEAKAIVTEATVEATKLQAAQERELIEHPPLNGAPKSTLPK